MINRALTETLQEVSRQYPVVTLTGPRQAGKTTLCRSVFPDLPYVNFERPDLRQRFGADPNAFLSGYPEGAVFDEFQRVPEVTSYLQALVDEPSFAGTFILTGSQNLVVRDTVSQSLAGRTAVLELFALADAELQASGIDLHTDDLLYSGGYPRIYDRGIEPTRILADYVATYVERDLRQLSMIRDLAVFQTFLGLCAGRTAQILNLEQLGNEAGVSQPTVREWISLLEASYIAFRLPPYHVNIAKRLIKSPKLYFYDVGLVAYLLGIDHPSQLHNHPLRGALFETFAVSEVVKALRNAGRRRQLHFYRDSHGNEVDLILSAGAGVTPIEIKSTRTLTPALLTGLNRFRKALADRVQVRTPVLVYDGSEAVSLAETDVVPRRQIAAVISGVCRTYGQN